MTKRLQLQMAALGILAVSGCLGKQEFLRQRYWVTAQRPPTETPASAPVEILELEPFSIDSAFAGTGIVTRRAGREYEKSFYEEYLSPPARMITEQTRRWVDDSGLFARVLPPGSTMEPTHLLEGHISKLYADYTADPTALQLEISMYLLKGRGDKQQIRFAETYSVTQPMNARNAQAYFAALEKALTEVLTQFESDVAAATKEQPNDKNNDRNNDRPDEAQGV